MSIGNVLRRVLLVMAVLCTFAACRNISSPSANKLGIHLLLDDGRGTWPVETWPEHLHFARQAAGEWGYVTELAPLDDLDVGKWQVFLDLCADLYLILILYLVTI